MGVNVEHWNNIFKSHWNATGKAYNDAATKPIEVVLRNADGLGFNCIGIHYLTPEENGGQHNVFLDVLDAEGVRIEGARIMIDDGLDQFPTVVCDKPPNEACTNFVMFSNIDNYKVLQVNDHATDKVVMLNAFLYPGDVESPGNTLYHQSFYVVYQWGAPGEAGPVLPPVDPPDSKMLRVDLVIRLDDEIIDTYTSEVEIPC